MGTGTDTWGQRVPEKGKKEIQPGRPAGIVRSFPDQSHEGIASWASPGPAIKRSEKSLPQALL